VLSALDFLTKNPVTYFATVDNNNSAKVRPILFCFEEGGVLWFCSGKNKKFWKELQANPNTEFCSFDGNRWIRVSGTVRFDDILSIKKKILDRYDNIRAIYKTPDNPEFVVFCFDHWNATIYSFTDTPVTFSR
jgi:uncharacterized pyridoxamine 5'-phosphate oxidase family protein